MAVEKVVNITVKKKGDNVVKDLNKELKTTDKELDKVNDGIEDLGKNSKKSESSVKGLSKGFSSIKLGVIGLVVAAFSTLKDLLSENQKVLDFFNGTFRAASVVINNVVNAVADSSEGFDSLGKVLLGVINLALTPLKVAFYGIKLAVLETQKLWEESVFGGKDQDKIDTLNQKIKESQKSLKEVGESALQSAKDVATNFSEAITEIGGAVVAATNAVEETSIKAAFAQGQRLVQLQKDSEKAQALNQGLIEKYDQQAEKLRQLRDDESKSVEERAKANEELGIVLDKQTESMQKNADLVLENAQAQYDANQSQENYIALIDAQNEKLAIAAQVEGFRSEQLVNRVALEKEAIELSNTALDSEKERKVLQLQFDAEREENEAKRLEKLKESIAIEEELALTKLERERELYKEGTQARIDSEQEYLNTKQELANREQEIDSQTAANKKKTDESLKDAKLSFGKEAFAQVVSLADEESEIGKSLAIGQATISGIEGVQNAYTTAQESPITAFFPGYPLVQAGLAGAFSALQIGKIKNTSASGEGSSSATTPSAPTPTFNLNEGTQSNQIANAIGTQNDKPIQAVVVSSNVTTAQELDRNIINEGSI